MKDFLRVFAWILGQTPGQIRAREERQQREEERRRREIEKEERRTQRNRERARREWPDGPAGHRVLELPPGMKLVFANFENAHNGDVIARQMRGDEEPGEYYRLTTYGGSELGYNLVIREVAAEEEEVPEAAAS